MSYLVRTDRKTRLMDDIFRDIPGREGHTTVPERIGEENFSYVMCMWVYRKRELGIPRRNS